MQSGCILDGIIELALNLSIKSNDLISAKKVAKYSLEHNWINKAIRCYVLADDIDNHKPLYSECYDRAPLFLGMPRAGCLQPYS